MIALFAALVAVSLADDPAPAGAIPQRIATYLEAEAKSRDLDVKAIEEKLDAVKKDRKATPAQKAAMRKELEAMLDIAKDDSKPWAPTFDGTITTGSIGVPEDRKGWVYKVVDSQSFLLSISIRNQEKASLVLVRGVSTHGIKEGDYLPMMSPLEAIDVYSFKGSTGIKREAPVIVPFDVSQAEPYRERFMKRYRERQKSDR